MKNILFFIALLVTPCFIHAQEHLDFRGIPIDGSLEDMSDQLTKLGYEKTDSKNTLSGKFIGKDCYIIIQTTEYTKEKMVREIGIMFKEAETKWSSLKYDYNSIKEMYNKKYGNGDSIEYFSSPYEEGDGYEMLAIRTNKCTYATRWELENGTIYLLIMKSGQILISYSDKINNEVNDKEKSNSFMNEI